MTSLDCLQFSREKCFKVCPGANGSKYVNLQGRMGSRSAHLSFVILPAALRPSCQACVFSGHGTSFAEFI